MARFHFDIGDHSYGAPTIRWWGENANLKIGKYCSFADQIEIFLGGNHRMEWVSTYPFQLLPGSQTTDGTLHSSVSKGDVVIGNDVWVGSGAVILSGVTLGDGSVIGARAVVAKDVAPYQIVVGNPAVAVGSRFEGAQVAKLLAIRWWDWDDDKVRRSMPLLMSSNLDAFFESAGYDR
ncbi:MAG: CatB-related O-acetyltransferase [Rhizobiaceae bacterium]